MVGGGVVRGECDCAARRGWGSGQGCWSGCRLAGCLPPLFPLGPVTQRVPADVQEEQHSGTSCSGGDGGLTGLGGCFSEMGRCPSFPGVREARHGRACWLRVLLL